MTSLIMNKLTIILDVAHGEETPGKRSPDGLFREYKWSREVLGRLQNKLEDLGYTVYQSNTTNTEIGLPKRVSNANAFTGKNKIFISLHSDAAGNGSDWMQARGYSVYTTPGKTNSDKIAEIVMKQFAIDFPELKARPDKSDGDLDKEANFYVIKHTNCPSILIEWCFQDNKEDVKILLDENYNNKLIESLLNSINTINQLY